MAERWWNRISRFDLFWTWAGPTLKPWLLGGVAVVVTLALTLWDNVRPWQVFLACVWAAAGAVAFATYIYRLVAITKTGPTVTTHNIEDLLRRWFDERELSVKRRQVEKMLFAYEVYIEPPGLKVVVIRPKSPDHLLIIESGHKVTASDQKVLAKLSAEEVTSLVLELKIELNRMSMDYIGLVVPLNSYVVQRRVLISSSLNSVEMLGAIDSVVHAMLLIQHVTQNRLLLLKTEGAFNHAAGKIDTAGKE